MKKILVMLIMLIVALNCAFAADLSFLEDFQVNEGDELCVIMDINDAEEVSFRLYLNEDKTNPENYCNRIYRIIEGGKFEDSTFEVVKATFGGMDYTDYMDGYEFMGSDLIESIELDLRIFKDAIPEVKIDDAGSYYYGYNVKMNEIYDFVEEVVDYIDQEI